MNHYYNKDAEMTLLADIGLKADILAEISGNIETTDFYYEENKAIYDAMTAIYKRNGALEIGTIANELGGRLSQIGGVAYLSQVMSASASVHTYKQYADIVRAGSNNRKLSMALREANKLMTEENNYADVVNFLQTAFSTTKTKEDSDVVTLDGAVEKWLKQFDDRLKNGETIKGISTGYSRLDKAFGGFNRGDLMIIAGRPSMGKTAFILNIMSRMDQKNKVILFEMEMSDVKIVERFIGTNSRVNLTNLSTVNVNDREITNALQASADILKKGNILLNDGAGFTVSQIKAKTKKAIIQHGGVGVVIIDHIGKIRPENPRLSRNDQIGAISNELKNMAKDLDVCVVALSQLNRGVEGRTNKEPTLSDLRDSGNIEQDADQVLLLYREDYYEDYEEGETQKSELQVIVDKNRDGMTGKIRFDYYLGNQLIEQSPY